MRATRKGRDVVLHLSDEEWHDLQTVAAIPGNVMAEGLKTSTHPWWDRAEGIQTNNVYELLEAIKRPRFTEADNTPSGDLGVSRVPDVVFEIVADSPTFMSEREAWETLLGKPDYNPMLPTARAAVKLLRDAIDQGRFQSIYFAHGRNYTEIKFTIWETWAPTVQTR